MRGIDPSPPLLRRLGNGKSFVGSEVFAYDLGFARGPTDFDAVDLFRFAQPEVKRHDAVAEVTGFAVIAPVLGLASSGECDGGTDGVAI